MIRFGLFLACYRYVCTLILEFKTKTDLLALSKAGILISFTRKRKSLLSHFKCIIYLGTFDHRIVLKEFGRVIL